MFNRVLKRQRIMLQKAAVKSGRCYAVGNFHGTDSVVAVRNGYYYTMGG
jgi:hypothetical protein